MSLNGFLGDWVGGSSSDSCASESGPVADSSNTIIKLQAA
jgi:hypothetical protein